MDNQTRLQGFVELYKVQLERYDKRRDIEWKVTLSLLAGIAISTGFLLKEHRSLSWSHIWIYALVWLIFSFLWTHHVWSKNFKDMQQAQQYRNQIETLLDPAQPPYVPENPTLRRFIGDRSRITQISATALFLFLSWYVLQ